MGQMDMHQKTIELKVAPDIEDFARGIAESENTSVEAVLQDGLALLFGGGSLVEYQLDRLGECTDEELWAVIRQRLTAPQENRMQELLFRGSEGALLEQESAELRHLADLVDCQMLLRSRALALLQERGHDIDAFLKASPGAD